jgi:hypothetical protein
VYNFVFTVLNFFVKNPSQHNNWWNTFYRSQQYFNVFHQLLCCDGFLIKKFIYLTQQDAFIGNLQF